jgi:putative OPT family oligopeptide transporter
MAGAVISALVLAPLIGWLGEGMAQPLYPESKLLIPQMSPGQIWSRYVRYIGAGAVAAAGIISVLRGMPAMAGAFLAIARSFSKSRGADSTAPTPDPTDRDLPGGFVIGGIVLVVTAAALVPGIFAGDMDPLQRAVCAAGVGVFGILFVAVAARIVGIVGVSSQPVSGMTLVTLLGVAAVFAAAGWTDPGARAAVLTVGTIVAVAASKAGDISQDLKTGYLVGATPAYQQFGQLIGASVACWAVAGAVMLLGNAYEFGSADVPAPQATLMKTVIEGVLAGDLPWGLVLTGGGLSVGAMLCGASGLAFAIGVYLPFASMAPLFVGGCVRAFVDRGKSAESGQSDPAILAASGLVAGEALAGVVIAGLVALGAAPRSRESLLVGEIGSAMVLVAVGLLCYFLYRAGRRIQVEPSTAIRASK